MKVRSLHLLPFLILVSSGIILFTGCSDDNKSTIEDVDPEIFPTMKTVDVSTLVSDSGYTRYHITTDLWLMFDEAQEPHWTFPEGLYMERYNDKMDVESTFQSDSASYLSQKRIWQFDRDVRMKNTMGDRFATEQLFWDQNAQKVYSDSFIHIERTDRTLEGYGFVSNEEMTEYTILRVSGIFPTPQREERESKETVTDSIDSLSTPEPAYETRRKRREQQVRPSSRMTESSSSSSPKTDSSEGDLIVEPVQKDSTAKIVPLTPRKAT